MIVRYARSRVYQHLVKQGMVRHPVTKVAHNTRCNQNVKNSYVSHVDENINIGRYCPQYIVSMDDTNSDFDQEAGETLVNRGDIMIGQSVTGSANRCTVLLAVIMSGKKCHLTLSRRGKIKEAAECGKSSRQQGQ
jgi:hypothetical protein